MSEKRHFKYICTSTNAEGHDEQELIDWYTSQHFHDILALPGIVGVQFYGIADEQFREIDRPHPFVVIWDVYTDDPHETFEQMRQNGQNGTTVFSDAFGDWYDICVQPLSKYVKAEEIEGKSVAEVGEISERDKYPEKQ